MSSVTSLPMAHSSPHSFLPAKSIRVAPVKAAISPVYSLTAICICVMGHKFSAVHGVKSDNFYEQDNAINEIWVGDVEIISRLPFGDSDLGQAGWPPGSWPKIPWHQFIIPLKRSERVEPNHQWIVAMNLTEFEALMRQMSSSKACTCLGENQVYPTTGYFGMYTGLSEGFARIFGLLTLGAAGMFCMMLPFMVWNLVDVVMHFIPWGLDGPWQGIVRATNRWLRIGVVLIIISFTIGLILCILGLPAVTYGVIHYDAPGLVVETTQRLIITSIISATGMTIASVWRVKNALNRWMHSASAV